jgi:hypothetical protein
MKKSETCWTRCPSCNSKKITRKNEESHPIINEINCFDCGDQYIEQGKVFPEGLMFFVTKKEKKDV